MDDDVTYKYGQVVYFYNVDMVRIMVPNALTKPGSGLAIYTGILKMFQRLIYTLFSLIKVMISDVFRA